MRTLLQSDDAPKGEPSDYFPTDIGHRWNYRITLNEGADALNHSMTRWEISEKEGVKMETRGRYYIADEKKKPFYHLTMSIKGPAASQGPLLYPEGYELAIEQDDLGIFEWTKGVFFAISKSARYSVDLVILHDPTGPGAPTSGSMWGRSYNKPGYTLRVYFFGERPGVEIGLSDENDATLFDGPTTFRGKPALKFIRTVKGSDRADDAGLNKGFTEEMYFVYHVGLAQLTQKVSGTTTMTWELE